MLKTQMLVPKLKVTFCTDGKASRFGAFVHVVSLKVIIYETDAALFWSAFSMGLYGAVCGAEVTKPLVVLQKQVAFHYDP